MELDLLQSGRTLYFGKLFLLSVLNDHSLFFEFFFSTMSPKAMKLRTNGRTRMHLIYVVFRLVFFCGTSG
jgi:hypothetical protein